MKSISLSLLCLLWSLVEVQSQTEYPYVSFKGNRLLDHSYVNFDEVGQTGSGPDNNTVQCHTDLSTCCSTVQASPRGDWFFPNDTRLPFFTEPGDIKESLQPQVVHIRRLNPPINGPSGIYRCFIGTNAVHSNSDPSVGEAVYVGLYGSGGGTHVVVCTCTHSYVYYHMYTCVVSERMMEILFVCRNSPNIWWYVIQFGL